MKRLFTILFATMLAGQAWPQDFNSKNSNGQTLYYKITSDSTVTVTYPETGNFYNSPDAIEPKGGLIIPETATSYSGKTYYVTSIGKDAFYGCKNLNTVDIPNTVTSIYEEAFCGCKNLKSVSIPNSTSFIADNAFKNCSSLIYNTDGNASYLGNAENSYLWLMSVSSAAYSCNVNSNCKYILYSAFRASYSMKSVNIPNSVICIGKLNSPNLEYTLYEGGKYVGNEENPYYVFCGVESKDTSSIELHNDCKVIASEAFSGCNNLTELDIPASVIGISYSAFYNSKLTSITIPHSVAIVGNNAFSSYLSSIIIESDADFRNSNLYFIKDDFKYRVLNKNSVEVVPNHINGSNSYKGDLVIPEAITMGSTFSVTSIGNSAFADCKSLTSANIPTSVKCIEARAFYGCSSLKSVTIPNSVTSIGNYAFYYSSLNLKSITIPESVISIGKEALCNNGQEIICKATVPPMLESQAIYKQTCYVPSKSVEVYKQAKLWKDKYLEIKPFYVISAKSENDSYGTVQGDSLLLSGKTLTLNPAPAEGYHFVKWSDGNTDNPRIYATASDTSFTAAFEAHTIVSDTAVAATCTTTGLTEGSHCSVCGEVIVAQSSTKALGHTIVIDSAIAATCIKTGLTKGKHCSVCNTILVAQKKVSATGHTEVVDAVIAATCTKSGLTEGKHCSVCNEILVAQDTIEALGHTEVGDAAVAATCTESGKTEGKHCSVCNEILVAQTEIPALGHEFVNYVYNNDATTAVDGTETAICERGCGATDTRVKEGTKLPEDHTAVSESAADKLLVYAHGNTIVVENATDEIRVYNAMGALVGRDAINRVRTGITVSGTGVYLVKVGNAAKRVMVKE